MRVRFLHYQRGLSLISTLISLKKSSVAICIEVISSRLRITGELPAGLSHHSQLSKLSKHEKMEDLHLSDTLQRYFSDFFVCCDEESSGKVPVTKAVELIKSGNVPDEIITQVSSHWFVARTYFPSFILSPIYTLLFRSDFRFFFFRFRMMC